MNVPKLVKDIHASSRPLCRWHALGLLLGCLAMSQAHGANIIWTGSTDGSWSDTLRWSPHVVPGASDNAFITNNGTFTVTLDVDATVTSLTLGGNTGVQTFDLDAPNTLTLNGASLSRTTNCVFQLTGGTLTGPGNLTLAGPFETTGGSILGASVLRLNGGGRILGPSVVDLFGRTLVNAGVLAYTGGELYTGTGSVISNLAGATIDLAADVGTSFKGENPPGVIYNAGLVRKSVDESYTSEINDVFNSTGTVEVQRGALVLNQGGTISGSNGISAGATLSFGTTDPSPAFTFTASSQVAGPGNVAFNDGTVDIQGAYAVSGTNTVSWGTVNFRRAGLTLGRLELTALGTANFLTGAGVSINDLQMLASGTLGGTDDLTLSGPLTWNAGWFSGGGRVQCNGGVTIDTDGSKAILGRLLVNANTLNWLNGAVNTGAGSIISNQPNATIILAGPATTLWVDTASPPGAILNAGLLRKLAGNGVTYFSDILINAGTFELQPGALTCYQPYTQTAGQTVLAGGELDVSSSAQPFALNGGVLAGNGTVTGDVFSRALISPGASPGLITITGDYMENTSASLQIELGATTPGTGFDKLTVQGTASLAGTLNAALVGGFYPAPAATFTFLTTGSRIGTFSHFNYPSNMVGLLVNYAPASAAIKVANTLPSITGIPDRAIDELAPFSLQVQASDGDSPAQPLAYGLVSPPTGMNISPTGLITWTPAEDQGPGTYKIVVTVTDTPTGSVPRLTATNRFTLTVNEVNSPPALDPIADRTIHAATLLSMRLPASDSDSPTNTLSFSLPTKPVGMAITQDGLLTWPTSDAQAGTTNPVAVKVADNGSPSLSATQNFKVIVMPRPALSPLSLVWQFSTNDIFNNQIWHLYPRLTWTSISNTQYRILYGPNAGTNTWTGWPITPPPVILPGYVTATGAVTTVLGPSVGMRVKRPLDPIPTETVDPLQFFHVLVRP